MKRLVSILLLGFISILIILYLVYKFNIHFNAYVGNSINRFEKKTLNNKFLYKIKSGNLSTDYDINKVLADVEILNLDTVNVPVAVNVANLSSSDMEIDPESLKKARELIKRLNRKNFNIILEPYPWIDRGTKYETDWKPENMDLFFTNWKNKVINRLLKEVAIPYHVDAFIIASNFVHMEQFDEQWCDMADFIKQYYLGLITYKTSWWYTAEWDKNTLENYQNKLNRKIFSKVDFISIAAYFELTDKGINTTEDLEKALYKTMIYNRKQNVVEEIEQFNKKWNKPIYFGELGFPNRNNASNHPWQPEPSFITNNDEQAHCFEAYRNVFRQDWFLGFSVFAIGENGDDKHYYPQREAIEIIKNWWVH